MFPGIPGGYEGGGPGGDFGGGGGGGVGGGRGSHAEYHSEKVLSAPQAVYEKLTALSKYADDVDGTLQSSGLT